MASASSQRRSASVEPAAQLGVRAAPERGAPLGSEARRLAHARILSPFGSQSGSRTTSAPTHSPKTSISPRVPDRRRVRRQVGVGDAALDREAVAAGGHPPDDGALRPAPARCRGVTERGSSSTRQAQALCAARPPSRARSASRPMKSAPLSSATAKPSPASYGVSSGVMSRGPDAIALLEPQGVDGAVAAGQHAVAARRPPRGVSQSAAAVLGRGVELPAELADVGDPERQHGHVADGGSRARSRYGKASFERSSLRERREDVAGQRSPEPEAGAAEVTSRTRTEPSSGRWRADPAAGRGCRRPSRSRSGSGRRPGG